MMITLRLQKYGPNKGSTTAKGSYNFYNYKAQ